MHVLGGDSAPVIRYLQPHIHTAQEAPMAGDEQKHVHGKMDVSEQEKTFAGFVRWSVWIGAGSIGILIFLALSNA